MTPNIQPPSVTPAAYDRPEKEERLLRQPAQAASYERLTGVRRTQTLEMLSTEAEEALFDQRRGAQKTVGEMSVPEHVAHVPSEYGSGASRAPTSG
jgi:hypothetical protein